MHKKMFAELVESIEQMGTYLRGEIPPERLKTRTYEGYQIITIEDPPEAAPRDADPPS
jgi:hypothetical protein